MKKNGILIGGLLGGVTAFIVAVLSELVRGLFGLPGIAFSLFDWLTRHLPGPLITLFIDSMVKVISALRLGPTSQVAKQIEQASAVAVFVVIGVVFGIVLTALGRRGPDRLASYGMWGGVVLLLPLFVMILSLGILASRAAASAIWLGLLFMGWGWILGKLIEILVWPAESEMADPSRRRFLYLVGAGSFTVLVSAVGVSLVSNRQRIPNTGGAPELETKVDASTTSGEAQSPPVSELAGRFDPVPGTRPELTANANFYRIDINTIPPRVDAAQWRLTVNGLVDHPLQLALDDLVSRPSVSQAITLECISNEVGGDLTSSSLWTGVKLKDILKEAGLKPGVKEIFMTAADGFYESVPLTEAMDDRTLLVYQMNGQPLPVEHGFPLRIYIPNHFGMKQPKWLTGLEAIDHEAAGYWVERGWSKQAIPPTTSVIDTVDTEGYDPNTGTVPVGGIAFAGSRGISKVEVQVDEGPWKEAELRTPALSPLTWVQWRYLWKSEIGQHTFRVRAYDGAGKLQTADIAPPAPDGATGIYSKTAFLTQDPQQENQ